MNRVLILLRPQPGNDASAEKARALGLQVEQLPLFEIVPVEEEASPLGSFDALLITSANGARFGGSVIAQFSDLPIYAVGAATADALRATGAKNVHVGGGDAASTLPLIADTGVRHLLHICGEETRPFDPMGLLIDRHIVYRAEARDMRRYAKALATLPPSVFAIHSPAAGRRLNAILPIAFRNHMLAAISPAAAAACGKGWRKVHVAERPDDPALLRLASTLCMDASKAG